MPAEMNKGEERQLLHKLISTLCTLKLINSTAEYWHARMGLETYWSVNYESW